MNGCVKWGILATGEITSAFVQAAALCIAAGRAVLCEKPLTINAGEEERLIAQAQHHGVFLMEAMWMRTTPARGCCWDTPQGLSCC